MAQRVLILGAGFAGSYVARYLSRAAPELALTLVDPHNFMLYTPLLPEAASGTVEPRHTVVPVRMMCPSAVLLLGRATDLDLEARRATVEPAQGPARELEFDQVVVALGGITRTAPVPGLREHAIGFKTIEEAIALRNHVLGQLELASTAPDEDARRRQLTFVVVGGGYAGVEVLAELEDLARDALHWYPTLRGVSCRWLLLDMAPHILPELQGSLGRYATDELRRRGVEIRTGTQLESVDDEGVVLSDGSRVATATVIWTAGVRPNPMLERFGLPLDERGHVRVDGKLRIPGHEGVAWSLGDGAAVPNARTPGRTDPPTCQHALRQARTLARNVAAQAHGEPLATYGYRMLGQVATLGNGKGVAEVLGLPLRGWLGWWTTRSYHLYQLPLLSRKLRVVADWTVGLAFRRDVAELGSLGHLQSLPPDPSAPQPAEPRAS